MIITKIYVRPLENPNKRLYGVASIILDEILAINNIKIIRTKKRFCIEFPKEKNFRETVAPLNTETRNYIETEILNQFFIKQKRIEDNDENK